MCGKKDEEYFRDMLIGMLKSNAIHYSLLEEIPQHPGTVGKTKFDQLYDAAQKLAFPDYHLKTLKRLLGEEPDPEIKIWRVILPEEYKISAVLIRAYSFQDAFSLGCDYACRLSLRIFHRLPRDLNIRVMFVSDRALRRHLNIREVNRNKKRHELKLEGREFTPKQIAGARIFALGHEANDPKRSLARYVEKKDLERISHKQQLYRVSGVESEILISDMKKLQKAFDDES